MDLTRPSDATAAARRRPRDRERTREEILTIAREEFAENGLSGGNTEVIAARAGITKRMIFYYFKTKEELFATVLERAYATMRRAEEDLRLEALTPEVAIRTLARFTFDFDNANPDFVRLVMIENIHRARHLCQSERAREISKPIIGQIARVLARGEADGAIRKGIDPVELHMTVTALCWYSVANRQTFETLFAYDMSSEAAKAKRREQIADMLWKYVRAEHMQKL